MHVVFTLYAPGIHVAACIIDVTMNDGDTCIATSKWLDNGPLKVDHGSAKLLFVPSLNHFLSAFWLQHSSWCSVLLVIFQTQNETPFCVNKDEPAEATNKVCKLQQFILIRSFLANSFMASSYLLFLPAFFMAYKFLNTDHVLSGCTCWIIKNEKYLQGLFLKPLSPCSHMIWI